MKNKKYKQIIYVLLILWLLAFLNNLLVKCDIHIFECHQEECAKCLFIQFIEEIIKNIFVLTSVAIILGNIKIINNAIILLIEKVYNNLIFWHVILIE